MFSTQIDVDVFLTKDKRGYSVHLVRGSEMKINTWVLPCQRYNFSNNSSETSMTETLKDYAFNFTSISGYNNSSKLGFFF